MAERLAWPRRLQTRLRREAAFLPKRLVLVALLLLGLYLVLLVRTEYNTLYTRLGFVEARLKSKLIASYDAVERPAVPFAPLRLAIIKAKIQDENPYLSEREVATLVQMAIAAADAPIVRATPTPLSHVPATVNAAIVISTNLVVDTQAPVAVSTSPVYQDTPGFTLPPAIGLETGAKPTLQNPHQLPDQFNGNPPLTLPTAPVAAVQSLSLLSPAHPTATPGTAIAVAPKPDTSLGEGIASTQQAVSPVFGVATAVPSDTIAAVTQLAASKPSPRDTPLFTSIPTTPAMVLLATSLPAATWTPWPIPTPLTVTPLPVMPLPTVMQNPTVAGVQLFVTVTPLVLPPATALAIQTPNPVAPVSLLPTTVPTASAPQPPTPTQLPPLTATATTVILPTLTPTITARPWVDHLNAYVEGDKIYLEWPTALTTGIVGYNLYRQDIANGHDERINGAPIQSPSYIDTVALDGRQYLYRVTLIDQFAQESFPSQAVTVTVADRLPPQIPGNLLAQLVGEHVQLAWDANVEADLIGYNIYRDIQSPVGRSQGPLNGATLVMQSVYSDTILTNGQPYYYSLTAVDVAGNESALSPEVQIVSNKRSAPAPPSGLTAVFEDDDDNDDDEDNEDEINLKWQANQEADVIGYRLYRSTVLPVDTTTVAPLHQKPLLTTLRYKDEDLGRDTTYYYVVVAVAQDQTVSQPSAPVAVVVPK